MKKTKKRNTMVQAFKNLKTKYQFLIVSGAFIVVGLLIFVLAYGLSVGWVELGLWFVSKWAIMFYIGISVWVLFAIWLFVRDKVKNL